MIRKGTPKYFGVLAIVALCLSIPVLGQTTYENCSDVESLANSQVEFVKVAYDFPEPGQSTWFYKVGTPNRGRNIKRFSMRLNSDCNLIENFSESVGTWDLDDGSLKAGKGRPKMKITDNGARRIIFNQRINTGETRGYYITFDHNYAVRKTKVFVTFASRGSGQSGDKKVDALICGPASTCENICTDVCASPRRLKAEMTSDTSVLLTWDKLNCHKSYKLCGFAADGSVAGCRQVTGGSRHFKMLERGQTYYLYMRSNCKGIGTSEWSDTIELVAQDGYIAERVSAAAVPHIGAPTAELREIFEQPSTELTIYPNPVVDQMMVEHGSGTWKILSYQGVVYRSGISNKDERLSIDVADLPNGLYFFEIENSGGREVQTFLIAH